MCSWVPTLVPEQVQCVFVDCTNELHLISFLICSFRLVGFFCLIFFFFFSLLRVHDELRKLHSTSFTLISPVGGRGGGGVNLFWVFFFQES